MTQKHTPLYYSEASGSLTDFRIWQGDDGYIATAINEEHAAFIVRACNSHYELLEIAKAAKQFFPPSWKSTIASTITKATGEA